MVSRNYGNYQTEIDNYEPYSTVYAAVHKLAQFHSMFLNAHTHWTSLTDEQRKFEHEFFSLEVETIVRFQTKCIENLLQLLDQHKDTDVLRQTANFEQNLKFGAHSDIDGDIEIDEISEKQQMEINQVHSNVVPGNVNANSSTEGAEKIDVDETLTDRVKDGALIANKLADNSANNKSPNKCGVGAVTSPHMEMLVPYGDFHRAFEQIWLHKPIKTVSFKSLTNLSNCIKTALGALNLEHNQKQLQEQAIVSVLQSKLDVTSRVTFSYHIQSKPQPAIDDFMSYLEHRSQNIQPCELGLQQEPLPIPSMPAADYRVPSTSTATTVSSGAVPKQSTCSRLAQWDSNLGKTAKCTDDNSRSTLPMKWPCPCCRNMHALSKCKQFRTATFRARKQIIVRARLCINCFSPYHSVKNCPRSECHWCNIKHNSLMCPSWDDLGFGPSNKEQ